LLKFEVHVAVVIVIPFSISEDVVFKHSVRSARAKWFQVRKFPPLTATFRVRFTHSNEYSLILPKMLSLSIRFSLIAKGSLTLHLSKADLTRSHHVGWGFHSCQQAPRLR
jgi:hypothetical protein